MIVRKIQLKNFRNYENLDIELNKKINVFLGNNGQGKTNILESIYVLAITKSYRTNQDTDLIRASTKSTKIKGIIKKKESQNESELEILINNKGKKVSINKKPIKKISEYISYFNVITFHPDDLILLKGSPSERRKFLNVEIGQLDNQYLMYLNNYNTILKNRNDYLKKITLESYDSGYLDIITRQLVDNAVMIYMYRQDFIDKLNKAIKKVNGKIKGLEDVELKYETSVSITTAEEIKQALIEKYKNNLQREIFITQTITGPHRDNFLFFMGENNIKDFGSQGQQRMAVLSLKLAEIEIFKEKKGEYPLLLLDDVFSELDNRKKIAIMRYLSKRMQIVITTTDINNIDISEFKEISIFMVKNGVVKEENQNKYRGDINERK
ncbi:MAG TPA: DNA replication/repair protein RecF [Mollicutes bacterium]|nr:DNA replication/repair protein RecF [Mollicutes bacterium]